MSDEQPNSVTFYFDTTHGKLIPRLLRDVGLDIRTYGHLGLTSDADDKEWIALCGQRNWVIISGDKSIARVPEERQAVINAGCKVFMFEDSDVTRTEDWAASVLVARQRIIEMAQRTHGPYFVTIKPCRSYGHIRQPEFCGGKWRPPQEWPKAFTPPIERPHRTKRERRAQQSKMEFPESSAAPLAAPIKPHCGLCARLLGLSVEGSIIDMKPTPPPQVPGKNDSERFQNALARVLSAPKAEQKGEPTKPKK